MKLKNMGMFNYHANDGDQVTLRFRREFDFRSEEFARIDGDNVQMAISSSTATIHRTSISFYFEFLTKTLAMNETQLMLFTRDILQMTNAMKFIKSVHEYDLYKINCNTMTSTPIGRIHGVKNNTDFEIIEGVDANESVVCEANPLTIDELFSLLNGNINVNTNELLVTRDINGDLHMFTANRITSYTPLLARNRFER